MAEKNDENIIKRGISLSYSFFRFLLLVLLWLLQLLSRFEIDEDKLFSFLYPSPLTTASSYRFHCSFH